MANNFLRLALASVAYAAQKGGKVIAAVNDRAGRAAEALEAKVAEGVAAKPAETKPVSDPDAGKASE